MNQITSFSIDWFDCGLCCALEEVHEKTTIYLRKSLIKIEKYNGLDELIQSSEYFVPCEFIKKFFEYVNILDLNNEWKDDYIIEVCDGSRWEMRLRYSDKTIKLIKGTIEKPDKGRKIEKMIKDTLTYAECSQMPILFGC